MDEPHCGVGVRAADMHVLPEHGELLGEIAVQLGDIALPRRFGDVAFGPGLKRVRATAANADVEQFRGRAYCVAQCTQVREHAGVGALHRGRDFDHAFGDLELDVEPRMPLLHQRNEIGAGAREVAIAPVDELQLQLHAEGERLRGLEFELFGHASSRVGSPARRSASSVRAGPRMAMSSTIAPLISAACLSSGCCATLAVSISARLDSGAAAMPTRAPLAGLNAEGEANAAFAPTFASKRIAATATATPASVQESSQVSDAPTRTK